MGEPTKTEAKPTKGRAGGSKANKGQGQCSKVKYDRDKEYENRALLKWAEAQVVAVGGEAEKDAKVWKQLKSGGRKLAQERLEFATHLKENGFNTLSGTKWNNRVSTNSMMVDGEYVTAKDMLEKKCDKDKIKSEASPAGDG